MAIHPAKHHRRSTLYTYAKSLILASALLTTTTNADTELQSLQARLDKLEAQQNQQAQHQARTQAFTQLVDEVLADIDNRSAHLAAGAAGHNGNFFLQSEDTSNLLIIKGHVQVRYILNSKNNAASGEDEEAGFQLRRAKIKVSGKKSNTAYKLSLAANRDTSNIDLEEFALKIKLNDNLTFIIGRDKIPFNLEAKTSASKQVAVERSRVNAIFEPGRAEGVSLQYKNNDLHAVILLSDGAKSGEISTSKDFQNNTADIAISARATYKIMGNWKQAADQSAWEGQDKSLFIGAGFHFQDSNPLASGAPLSNGNTLSYTLDAAYKHNGLALTGALYGQTITDRHTGPTDLSDLNHYGATSQAAYFIDPNSKEIFIRVESYDIQGAANNVLWTTGFNLYQKKHAAKFSADIVWAVQPLTTFTTHNLVGSGSTSSGLGLMQDNNQDNQTALRLQYQLLF